MYEQQGADIDQQLAASVMSIEALKAQRDRLKSAGGNGGSRNTSGRNAAQAEEAARLEAAVKVRRALRWCGLVWAGGPRVVAWVPDALPVWSLFFTVLAIILDRCSKCD